MMTIFLGELTQVKCAQLVVVSVIYCGLQNIHFKFQSLLCKTLLNAIHFNLLM